MVAALGCAIAPASMAASVAAKSENAAATHAYLVATNSFEEAELANLPQSVKATEAAATQISGECRGILTDAPPHEEAFGFGLVGPAAQTRPSARAEGERRRQSRQLGDLKFELSFSLENSRTQPDRAATEALIRALEPLKWSNPEITFLLHLTIAAVKEELDIPAPAVCADMKAWVASGYETLSPASKEIASRTEALLKRTFEFIALYTQVHIEQFPKILAPYENAPDRALARHTEALTVELNKKREAQADDLTRLEAAVGLPAPKVRKVKPPAKKPPVIAQGKTAVGGRFVVRAERLSRSPRPRGCTVNVTITEPSRPQRGALLELLSGEGTERCLSRSHVKPEPAVHCNSGLLTVEANLLPATRSVRLSLSDGATITTPAILVPARLGGPAGLYYQVVRGPSPIPVSLTELDAAGRTLAVLKLPRIVECTKHPVKYFPGGIVRLVHESPPQIPAFTIRGEHYRKLGTEHFELKFEAANEERLFGGGGGGGGFGGSVAVPNGARALEPMASDGCEPQPYAIIYGLLRTPRDTVLARVSGNLVPLRKVTIPTREDAGGVLVYGAFSPLPTELVIRNENGKTVNVRNLAQAARSETEICEGEAEG